MLAAMHKYVNVNPEEFPAALVERLQLQRLLPLAIDRAIFENLPGLSERASSTACTTTVELILKVPSCRSTIYIPCELDCASGEFPMHKQPLLALRLRRRYTCIGGNRLQRPRTVDGPCMHRGGRKTM